MVTNKEFDYIIVGGGLAGLQLALAFLNNKQFDSSSIAVIEPSGKAENDKTWSFWEKGKGNWDDIVYHKWQEANFFSNSEEYKLDLGEYSYKTIRSVDFYRHAIKKIKLSENVLWVQDSISDIKNSSCIGVEGEYKGKIIFDSRVDPAFYDNSSSINVLQHFKGWVIETEEDRFNPNEFTMMDFRLRHQNSCCFTYTLPFTTRKALVEFTFFTPEKVEEKVYDLLLEQYITELLKIKAYTVVETEKGVIPMSTYPFHEKNAAGYLKIGTAGGWVKASSGYSFKNTEKKVKQLISNINHQKPLHEGLRSSKHEFFDRTFLRILKNKNELGNELFTQMYTRNKAEDIFEFLDEESSLRREFSIINSFNKSPFLRSLAKEIF